MMLDKVSKANLESAEKDINELEAKEIISKLNAMHRSQGYLVIRDILKPQTIKMIREDSNMYKEFVVIKTECKESWDYDHKTATMQDVNKAATNVYTIAINLLKAHKISTDDELGKIETAINKIEEHIGMSLTDWDNKDGENNGNVKGIKEDIQ